MITFDGLKVAVLGLTFKAGTDDLREAPSAENIKLLLEQGADIYAYDPVGVPRAKMQFPEGVIGRGKMNYVATPEEALQDLEGLQNMRYLGYNMAWILKCLDLGKASGISPKEEERVRTNFIR